MCPIPSQACAPFLLSILKVLVHDYPTLFDMSVGRKPDYLLNTRDSRSEGNDTSSSLEAGTCGLSHRHEIIDS